MNELIKSLKQQLEDLKADYIKDLNLLPNNVKYIRSVRLYYEDQIMEIEDMISNYESMTKNLLTID